MSRSVTGTVRMETPYPSEPTGGEGDSEAAYLSRELRDDIRIAVDRIRSDHRAALVLRYMRSLSYAEITETLNVLDGTVKSWISRGGTVLRSLLAEGERGRRKTAEDDAPASALP